MIILISLFILIKLFNTGIGRLFYKNRSIEDIVVNEIQEDINSLDFDKLIEKYTSRALQNKHVFILASYFYKKAFVRA